MQFSHEEEITTELNMNEFVVFLDFYPVLF